MHHRHDAEAIKVERNTIHAFAMLIRMHNYTIGEFENSLTTQEMWNRFKIVYHSIFATILRGMTLKLHI